MSNFKHTINCWLLLVSIISFLGSKLAILFVDAWSTDWLDDLFILKSLVHVVIEILQAKESKQIVCLFR